MAQLKKGGFKSYVGNREQRAKTMRTISKTLREEHYDQLRRRTHFAVVEMSDVADTPEDIIEGWHTTDPKDIPIIQMQMMEMIQRNGFAMFCEVACKNISSKYSSILPYAIVHCSDIMMHLISIVDRVTNQMKREEIEKAHRLILLLSDSYPDVIDQVIESGLINAIHRNLDMFSNSFGTHIVEFKMVYVAVFQNLASSKDSRHKKLCTECNIMSIVLKILRYYVGQSSPLRKTEEFVQVIVSFLIEFCKLELEWAQLLTAYGDAIVTSMYRFNYTNPEITASLAYCLSRIASAIELSAMEDLVPVFKNKALLDAMITCEYNDKETLVLGTLCKLLCASDDIVQAHLICDSLIVHKIKMGLESEQASSRLAAVNCVTNICAINDSHIHASLHRDGIFVRFQTLLHLDSFNVRKIILAAIDHVMCYADEEVKLWFTRQRILLDDLVDCVVSKDASLTVIALDVLKSILELVKGKPNGIACQVFASRDLENILNTKLFQKSSPEIHKLVADMLLFYYDYSPDDSGELDESSAMMSDDEDLVFYPGQTTLDNFVNNRVEPVGGFSF